MNLLLLLMVTGWYNVDGRTILDLTHTFDKNAPKWPLDFLGLANLTYFNMDTLYAASDDAGVWIALRKIEFYEHMGTHIDAPLHFGAGRQAMHEIPPERLIGPGVMIDVTEKAKQNPNYALSVDDILDYESKYGKIDPNSIVMMNSGWDKKYHDPNLVFGTDNVSDPSSFNFPGFSLGACKMLLQNRQVSVVGIDTPSVDPANATTYDCHLYLQPNNVPILEYVANLDTMPPANTTVFLGAMKHRGGTGGPTRIFAIVENDDKTASKANAMGSAVLFIYLAVLVASV